MKTNSDAYLQRDDIHSQGVMKTPMIHKEESKNGDDLKVQNFIDGKSQQSKHESVGLKKEKAQSVRNETMSDQKSSSVSRKSKNVNDIGMSGSDD